MAEVQEAELVRDPVCGMMIEPQDAVSSQEVEGKTYHFCNRSCATKFAADPKSYLQPVAKSADLPPKGQENVEYICPMDPEVHKMGRVPAPSAAWRSNPPP